jgi:hypothetical protein
MILAVALIAVAALLVVVVQSPRADASTCNVNYASDCTNPASVCTTPSATTFDTRSTPGGVLQGRYRGGSCRTVWARVGSDRNSLFDYLFTLRQPGYPAGDTRGINNIASGNVWSVQLYDANMASRAWMRLDNGSLYRIDAY